MIERETAVLRKVCRKRSKKVNAEALETSAGKMALSGDVEIKGGEYIAVVWWYHRSWIAVRK